MTKVTVDPQQETKLAKYADKPVAYREFLQFLELGCSGSPHQGYPAVVVIVSTIPFSVCLSLVIPYVDIHIAIADTVVHIVKILTPLAEFFTSFWAAIDGRALSSLDRMSISAAFLSSLLECTILLARRLRPNVQDQALPLTDVEELVGRQFNRVWDELAGLRLKVQTVVAGKLMAQTLASLERISGGTFMQASSPCIRNTKCILSPDLFSAAWEPLAISINQEFQTPNSTASPLISTVLNVFDDSFEDGTRAKSASNALMKDISLSSLLRCEDSLQAVQIVDPVEDNNFKSLVHILDTLGPKLFGDTEFVTVRLFSVLVVYESNLPYVAY